MDVSDILEQLQLRLNYKFQDPRLLRLSLVHTSYLSEKGRDQDIKEHNERLEFLGDAVLELCVTEFLYNNYKEDEGFLTSLRSSLVNYRTVGEVGNDIGLQDYILISSGERSELGFARLTIVADGMEAVLGAMFLDGGYEPCMTFVKNFMLPKLDNIISNKTYKDPKTNLQEYAQKNIKQTPRYKLIASEGKDHEKVFTIGVFLGGKIVGQGIGRSKQDAETEAAAKAMENLEGGEEVKIMVE